MTTSVYGLKFSDEEIAAARDAYQSAIESVENVIESVIPPRDISQYAVVIDDTTSVKRIEIDGKSYWFTPESSTTSSGTTPAGERVSLNGQVGFLEAISEVGIVDYSRNPVKEGSSTAQLFDAIKKGDTALALDIIANNDDINFNAFIGDSQDAFHNTPLLEAINAGMDDVAIALIKKDSMGVALQTADTYRSAKNNPLLFAVKRGNVEVTNAILDQLNILKADNPALVESILNTKDARGLTALHWASIYRDSDSIGKLIELGADTTITGPSGKTAGQYYAEPISGDEIKFPEGVNIATSDGTLNYSGTVNKDYSDLRWNLDYLTGSSLSKLFTPEELAKLRGNPALILKIEKYIFIAQRDSKSVNSDLYKNLTGNDLVDVTSAKNYPNFISETNALIDDLNKNIDGPPISLLPDNFAEILGLPVLEELDKPKQSNWHTGYAITDDLNGNSDVIVVDYGYGEDDLLYDLDNENGVIRAEAIENVTHADVIIDDNNVIYDAEVIPEESTYSYSTTETFHENGSVASRTLSLNGAEFVHQEFDENGNQTLKRDTTYQSALVDGKPVPIKSVTFDFSNGGARLVSKTMFNNGLPDTKFDRTYGTEGSFGDDLKLEDGYYTEETNSKFIDGQPVKTGSKIYDAEGNLVAEKAYDAQGRLTSQKQYNAEGKPTYEKTYNPVDNTTTANYYNYDSAGTLTVSHVTSDAAGKEIASGRTEYNEQGVKVSSEISTYNPETGSRLSLTESTFDSNGNSSDRLSTYDGNGVKTATGASVNGQWTGGVSFFDSTGAVSRVEVYANGAATGASYDVGTNTFSGINFDGVMSTQDLENFDKIVNSMREEGSLAFFDHPDNTKYGALIETLDFVQAMGLPISSIENFDLTKPTEFTLNVDALIAWTDQLDGIDPNARAANSDAAIRDFRKFLDLSKLRGASINGARTVGWFLQNVVAGDTGDIVELGRGLYKFAQNSSSSKIFGKTASNITPDSLGKNISKVSSASKAFTAAKFLGPAAAIIGVGLTLYSGITGFREAKANGASDAELAYWVFAATGGGPGGGITAAIVAKQNGGSPAQVAGAFFAGLFGAYTPGQPLIGSFKADERDREARIPSRDTLRYLNIPPNGDDPGFNGETYALFDGTALYEGRYDPAQENAFYNYMATYHSDSPNFVPRIPGVNGQYVKSDYFGSETYFEGEQWVWAEGQMPLYGVKDGAPSPATNVDDLVIVGYTDHPTPNPELVQTPEDDAEEADGIYQGSGLDF